MGKIWATFILIGWLAGETSAQANSDKPKKDKLQPAYFGFGAGLDYGGLGIKGEFLPLKWLGIFAGVGYNFVDPAFNAGFCLKPSDNKIVPVILAMYGYNAAIRIKDGSSGSSDIHRKSYYGMSAGVGLDLQFDKKGNKVSLAVLAPFRNAAFHRDYDEFKNAGYDFKPDIKPIAISLGVNFLIKNKSRE